MSAATHLRAMLPSLALGAALVSLLVCSQPRDPDRGRRVEEPTPPLSAETAPEERAARPATPEELAAEMKAEAHRWRSPPPTEHWLHEGAERENKQRRKAFMATIHKAPPDVDWRALERQNGLAQLAKRNALAQQPPAPKGELWVERGSDNLAGRMHVARHSTDGGTIYAGSSRGGIWKGDPDGGGWTPIGDNLYGGAHWLEVLPADVEGDPDIVLAATDGALIHRSADDGASWQVPEGLGAPTTVQRLLKKSDGSQLLFLISYQDGSWALSRSQDKGASFEAIYDLGPFRGDLWTPRDGAGDLYLASLAGLLQSEDDGESWTELGELPGEDRIELVGSEAGAPRLWAMADYGELYRSDDLGASWQYKSPVSDYWGSLNASQQDADLFAWGGVEVYHTRDGGESFSRINKWWEYYDDPANLLHADLPGIDLVVDETGQEIWYFCTDGGLYRSTDGLQSVENLSLQGLRVSQYCDTHTSTVNPEHIAGGSQDQGYQITATMEQSGELKSFEQIISGDYGHLTSSDGSHDYVYSVYPGFVLVQIGEDKPWLSSADFPSGESYVSWLPPIVADPYDKEAFFFPATRLYRYTPTDWYWYPSQYSDESLLLTGGEYVSALAFSPVDPERAYLATNNGGLYHSDDHGVSWTQSQSLGPDENWYYGQAIWPSITDVDTVYVGGSGYSVPAVYRSTNGGVSFQPFGDGLPDTLVYCLTEAPDGSGVLFAGTESAAYRRDPEGAAWYDITGDEAPVTTYWSVEPLSHENTVRFGTYGRGIWDYQLDPDHLGCYPVQDYDGDGTDCETDCDDHDAAVHPGAEELCDGADSNCDETDMDEQDADEDGWLACAECDDGDAAINPDAIEICGNGIDEDCDGQDQACAEEPAEEEPAEEEPAEEEPDPQSCGCAPGGAPPALPALLLAGLALLRRRDPES